MKHIKEFYIWLANIGLNDKTSLLKSKEIKIININSFTWIHISICLSIHDYIFDIQIESIITHFINIIVMVFFIYLNYLQKSSLAKVLWVSYFCLNMLAFALYIEPGIHIEYLLLLFPGACLCLFSNNTIGYVLIPITFILFCTPYYFIPVYPESAIDSLEPIIEFTFSICIFLMVLYFKVQNKKNEKQLLIEKDNILSDKIILEQQQKELKRLTEFKSHFFVNLSHEIRTPLTLIKGYRDEIDFSKSIQENQQHLTIIDEQLIEITSITDNILDLSKLDENKIILKKEKHSINLFLTKIFADFKPLYEQKKINLTLCLLESDVKVDFDFNLMTRSVNNIINNALKFTPEGGEVSLTASYNDQNDLSIQIKDNGIGIDQEEIIKIFDRFYQTKNHISKSKGSGIGLAFTKSIIGEHDFNISANSTINKGATFTVLIDHKFLIKSSETEIIANEQNLQNYSSNNTKTILLVDDHPRMRSYIKGVLKGFKVLEAENGEEALAIIKKTNIDLLITDYMMPVMDGWNLVNNIKKLQYTFPVFIITARIDAEGKLNMLRLGIDQYFTKPFHKEELLISIEKSIGYYNTITETVKTIELKQEFKINKDFENKLNSIITENMTNYNFGVEDIATALDISSKTLTRKTKAQFGQTPNQLIIEYKLLKAKKTLDENPATTLSEVANLVGIKNISYLKKRFQARFDVN